MMKLARKASTPMMQALSCASAKLSIAEESEEEEDEDGGAAAMQSVSVAFSRRFFARERRQMRVVAIEACWSS